MNDRLVVIGGGISGLAAAHAASHWARQRGRALEVVVLEQSAEPGGKTRTIDHGDWRIEAGPTGYLDAEPRVDALVEAAGLTKLRANAAAARRFVMHGGQLREVKPQPLGMARSGLLSPKGLARILREPWVSRPPAGHDQTIWEFAARRLGSEVADRLVAPMVLGVFAGDAKKISLRAAFPLMAQIEDQHGSLIRGLLARRRAAARARKADGGGATTSRGQGGPAGPRGVLTSFAEGMQALPRALAERGKFQVQLQTAVERVERTPSDTWRLSTTAGPIDARALVIATEPWSASALLQPLAPGAAELLASIYCPPVVVTALGYGSDALSRVPRGFGLLIPRSERFTSLGCLWDTHIFPDRSPAGHLLVRAMLGGATDPSVADQSDSELLAAVRDDLARMSGIRAAPLHQQLIRWPRAIPQYERGHLERAARVEEQVKTLPGVFLAGNGLHGVSFTKSAVTGLDAGERAAAWLDQLQ